MSSPQPPGTTQEPTQQPTPSLLPSISLAEWLVFALLAALLAVVNIYTVLLVGWGDGGSIIAVVASVLVLGLLGRKTDIYRLNLSQTMVSAGGNIGFAVACYGAVHIAVPSYDPSRVALTLLFAACGIAGVLVGSSVRKYMVRYYFPSGTACAVILKSVTEGAGSKRPVRILLAWGAVASLITIPVKITLEKGGAALLGAWNWGAARGVALGIGPDPLLYGIGIVVGPRIGIGMLIGSLAPILVIDQLTGAGIAADQHGTWVRWIAVAALTLPSFASILFAYVFRTPPVVPAGFHPGRVEHAPPPGRNLVYAGLAVAGTLATAIGGQVLFDLPFYIVILAMAVSFPMCIANGRVTGETDINLVRLVAIALLSLFVFIVAKDAVVLLGVAVVGGTLAAIAVDMMQDYRTGYLVGANPHHQTSMQLIGSVIGAVVSIPFFFLIIGKMGIGPGSALAAPGATVWATVAQGLLGSSELTAPLVWTIAAVSIVFAGLSYLSVWPKTAAYMPSVFGIGIGLLIPFEMSLAIFLGGCIKLAVSWVYQLRRRGESPLAVRADANNDTMLAGASVFAASAIVTVLLVALTELQRVAGWEWFWIATH